jgi:hypothetical protein
MSGLETTFSSVVRDTGIDTVRRQLDTLAKFRYWTGLSVAEEDRYRELCRSERALLHSAVPAAVPTIS